MTCLVQRMLGNWKNCPDEGIIYILNIFYGKDTLNLHLSENKNYRIIGTAGHIDHGKTCLVKALTGTDTDRLAEEKKRGITIENGFAFLDLPDGSQAGIIDVPGHEKFIKNMLAGAGGIHIAMLVIAADEGIMPQTAEHLDILSLLGISKGVVVLTKCDLTWQPGIKEKIRNFVQETFLENAPVVETSAVTGKGITRLKNILAELCIETYKSTRQLSSGFRLPVDRVFSLKGFGTVVTGTLLDGTLCKECEAVLYPSERSVKIRQIQVNGKTVDEAFPGQRTAVNLPGIEKKEISRGEVLAFAGSMKCTTIVDVQLKMLESGKRILKSGTRVHFYCGAAEIVCKIILTDRQLLKPGEEAKVQLRLEQPGAVKKGDHFVIRFYSPLETIGGGIVLEPNGVKRRKRKEINEHDIKKENIEKNIKEDIKENIKKNGNDNAEKNRKEKSVIYKQIEEKYLAAGFFPPLTAQIKSEFSKEPGFSEIFFSMTRSGILVHYDEKHYIHREFWQKALDMAAALYKEEGVIQTGKFRDRMGISRKCAIALLESFDKAHITILKDGVRKMR